MNIAEIIQDFEKEELVKEIILLGEHAKVRRIILENE